LIKPKTIEMKFTFRDGDLELRSCNKSLTLEGKHTTAEILVWVQREDAEEFCFAAAYWVEGKEGYDLHFVGSRPFEIEDDEWFMKLAKKGQQILTDFNPTL
jgi:hypothetical protein